MTLPHMNSRSTSRHLVLEALPERTVSVDVRFDDARIWSIDVRGLETPAEIDWPETLRPHLTGSTRLSVHDSASGSCLEAAEIAFDEAEHRTTVVDESGTPLVVNKWGRLGVALDAMGEDVQALIVERSAVLVEQLQQQGLRPFVVGGTLLGAVRSGALLPHDDDADIAYLSAHTHPVDVSVEAFRVGRALADLGYEIKRHSATHMQLLFRDADHGEVVHYIDVFAAFFTEDGLINQPFHVRGEMRMDQMLPFGRVSINGADFPAPADTDRWLTINYDANWRTPIPGYVLETPEPTRRRFDSWFGSFNFHRDFWDAHYASASSGHANAPVDAAHEAARDASEAQWAKGREWLLEALRSEASPVVLDLGCGSGALTRALQVTHPDARVVGLDYATEALRRASGFAGDPPEPTYEHINLYRARSLGITAELGIRGSFDVVANHVLDEIGHHGRGYAWRLMRMALHSGGQAAFTFHARHARDVTFEDPTGWHLEETQLADEAAAYGLRLVFDPIHEPLPELPEGVVDTMPLARAETFRLRSRRPVGAIVLFDSTSATHASTEPISGEHE